eukprot:2148954-Alexandrium_andersonii.AAC.1
MLISLSLFPAPTAGGIPRNPCSRLHLRPPVGGLAAAGAARPPDFRDVVEVAFGLQGRDAAP